MLFREHLFNFYWPADIKSLGTTALEHYIDVSKFDFAVHLIDSFQFVTYKIA